MAKDAEKALDVIGKKLKTKDQIDLDFSKDYYIKSPLVFEEITSNQAGEKKSPTDEERFLLKYKLSSPYFGLNVISNLNLGRAYKLIYNKEGDLYDYNIAPEAKRAYFPETEKFKMNEDWLRYVLGKVSEAGNSVLIIDDIFSQVTTGNFDFILPYKEQFGYICTILDEYPDAIKKTLAFVRGPIANKIIADGGPDLMAKLAEKYNCMDKLIDSEGKIEIFLNDKNVENANVSIRSYNPKTNARTGFFRQMEIFEKDNPGADIYYNTSTRLSGCFDGVTMVEKDGKMIEKPCTFICFGPMSEYDYFNAKRPALGSYSLNHSWYKVGYEPVKINGETKNIVVPRWEDYAFPHKDKEDTNNYISAVIGDNITEIFNSTANKFFDNLNKIIDQDIAVKSRRGVSKTLQANKKRIEKELLEEEKKKEQKNQAKKEKDQKKYKNKKPITQPSEELIRETEQNKKVQTKQQILLKEGDEQCK